MKTKNRTSTQRKIAKQAICDPIVLREGPQVRLAFVPTLVDDPDNSKARVDGVFTYERKVKAEKWHDIHQSLSSLPAGEGFKLPLSHIELLTLLESLVPLYKLYETTSPAIRINNDISRNRE